MNDNHIIRVIIQGYNRLSGPLREAAQQGSEAMDRLRDRAHRYRRENNQVNASINSMGAFITDLGDTVDRNASRIERFSNAWSRLRRNIGQRLGRVEFEPVESPEAMFDRLGREGRAPRVGGRFQSREDFIREETARRAALQQTTQAVRDQTDAFDDLDRRTKRLWEGRGPFDDVLRGIRQGFAAKVDIDEQQDTVAQQKKRAQEAVAAFDEETIARRRSIDAIARAEREATEAVLRHREGRVRDALEREEKLRDDFIRAEELKLRQFRISREAQLATETDPDRAIARSTAKAREEERARARERIEAARLIAAQEIAAEEAATQSVITNRKRQYENFRRDVLAGIDDGRREQLAADREVHTQRVKNLDIERRKERANFVQRQREAVANLPALIRQRTEERRERIGDLDTRSEIFGARAASALRDFTRGLRDGRSGLAEFRGEALRAQTTFAQIGAQVGIATQGMNRFVNVRWALVISLITVLGTVLVNLGAALVAIASSAVIAAAALGGALVAGVLQAIPVVGLLAASFNRLGEAMNVVKLREQARDRSGEDAQAQARARRDAAERLADANYALAQSIEGVEDAQRGIRDAHQRVTDAEREQRAAVRDLAEARKDAARAIVDASLDERDARLALEEAELGVLSAKQRLADFEDRRKRGAADLEAAQAAVREAQERLRIAREEGDQAEIAGAAAALADVQQNVANIKDQVRDTANERKELELGVRRAEINEEQARNRRQRAIEENRRRQQQGIEGSPEVTRAQERITNANRAVRDSIEGVADANRRLRDSQRSVVIAHRNVRDAQVAVTDAAGKMSAAQKNAKREFDQLAPAEQRFVLAMERFKENMKKYLNPITNIIVDAFSRGLNRAGQLLADPEIRDALTDLAEAVADVADKFTKWAISPEGRRTILFFIREATTNLPILAEAAGDFALALLRIARAASPVFRDIIDGFANLGGRAEEATQKTGRLERFFESAGEHLAAWGRLAGAITNVFAALVGASAGSGLEMVDAISDAFNRLAERIRENPEAIEEFFDRVQQALGELIPIMGDFALTLLDIFTSEEMVRFTEFILETLVPAILDLIRFLGFLAGAFTSITRIPLLGDLVGIVAQFFIFWRVLRIILPFTKIFDPIVIAILTLGRKGSLDLVITLFRRLRTAVLLVGSALRFVFITHPVIGIILGLIALVVLLDRKFHFLGPTIRAVAKFFTGFADTVLDGFRRFASGVIDLLTNPIDWLRNHWKDVLIAAILAPFGVFPALIYIALRAFFPRFAKSIRDGFLAPFEAIGRFFRAIGGWLMRNVIRPILSFFGISSPSTLMFRIGMDVVNGFLNAIKRLPGLVLSVFRRLPGLIIGALKGLPEMLLELFKGLGEKIFEEIFDFLPDPVKDAVSKAWGGLKSAGGKVVGWFGKVINRATGGDIPGREGQAVPVIAHAGEWVLNREQQRRLARRIGEKTDELKKWLFGSQLPEGVKPEPKTTGTKPSRTKSPFRGPDFSLHPHEDPDGNTVWFIEMGDRSWAQITARDATRIMNTKGQWIPQYIRRNRRGIWQRGQAVFAGKWATAKQPSFALGGVVPQSLARGGVVLSPGVRSKPSTKIGVAEQNFNVTVEREMDWHAVMRLGAIHAQESF